LSYRPIVGDPSCPLAGRGTPGGKPVYPTPPLHARRPGTPARFPGIICHTVASWPDPVTSQPACPQPSHSPASSP